MPALRSLLVPALALSIAACAAGEERAGYDAPDGPAPNEGEQKPATPGTPGTGLGDQEPPPTEDEVEVNEVYGHSPTTLYRLEPTTKAITVVGAFKGCGQVTDIALNEEAQMYAVSFEALYTVDKDTAQCTLISRGAYPNSLSFVPKGTLDAGEEALVGYDEAAYVRIDLTTGAVKTVGNLAANSLISSGDIVSVKGGSTYLTVKAKANKGDCSKADCLVEVDPATGKMLKNWGSVEHDNVFGLSFWGGRLYGFDESGAVFEVTFGTSQVATQNIPVPNKPAGLKFWGAGSSTSAPLVFGPK